ncbi:Dol-P-Man:Man(5)GlcNAc(2)-PP-Dol alpha-1,3-mannosyltransferase [Leucoagaricus sp. SymC.cos]|nr:Dol-P-Man:Man(5)GlcNAc(2)-PP-Dol alpha-1,3-mannosyltransferase [Leucoagaricus sp. SymC.cos]
MVKHLPPSIKHLLSLRNPHSYPGPPLLKLNAIFTKTYRDAQLKKAETGWLVLTTCTLLTANRPSTVGHLYRFVTRGVEETGRTPSGLHVPTAVNRAALMRESALKSVIFVGVPRVILSLAALHQVLDGEVKQALRTQSRRAATSENIESTVKRGRALWDSIYAPHADKLHDKLGSYHPDFISFIIQSYGTVLAPLPGHPRTYSEDTSHTDPDQGNLSRALGSVVGIATLRSEGRVGPQLVSHVFGLLKARYTEGQNEEDAWLSSDEGTEWVIRTVDEILDVVSSEAKDDQVQVKL